MKYILYTLFLFISISSIAQKRSDFPSNAQSGKCYVRCYDADGEKVDWKTIDCELVNFQKLAVR